MLCERLRQARSAVGLTQKEIAAKIYLSQQAYAKYETGTATPSPDTLSSISTSLGIPVDFLIGSGVFKNWDNIIKRREDVYFQLQNMIPATMELNNFSSEKTLLGWLHTAFVSDLEYDYIGIVNWFQFAVKRVEFIDLSDSGQCEVQFTPGFWAMIKIEKSNEPLPGHVRITSYRDGISSFIERQPGVETSAIRVPVLGRVAAGIPLDAVEEIMGYEDISSVRYSSGEYFGLEIKGQSMEPKISDGDVVIVRKQSDVDSGDIAVVLVNGDAATVKKIKKSQQGVTLIPNNPAYEPIYYSNKEIESLPVSIIGKVVELRAKL